MYQRSCVNLITNLLVCCCSQEDNGDASIPGNHDLVDTSIDPYIVLYALFTLVCIIYRL